MPVTPTELSTNPPNNPPAGRRPHTKSRKGCATCKRRHIRCDQRRPQCGNCQKHNVQCPYLIDGNIQTSQSPEAEAGPPRIEISEQIEQEVEAWKNAGAAPFPALKREYSKADLRLMYHISVICAQMRNAESQENTIWVQRVPLFLKLATEHEYVMHALLALAASHLSWTDSYQADLGRSFYHRAIALETLPHQVGDFSRENADAVLAASILLAWQETEWESWRYLMLGIQAVVVRMQEWRQKSQFMEYFEEVESFTAPPFRPTSPEEDIRWLNDIYVALTRLEPYFQGQEANGLNDLKDFLRNLAAHVPIQSDEAQFALLHPLRSWLMFLPISFAKKAHENPDTMVLLAHFYAVALAIEPLFPAVGASYFGSMALGPIRKLHEILYARSKRDPAAPGWPIQMMDFPLSISRDFRFRMGWKLADEVEEDTEMDGMNPHFMNAPSPSVSAFGSSDGSSATPAYHGNTGYPRMQFDGLAIQPLVDEDFYRGAVDVYDGVEQQRMLYRG